MQKPRYSLLTVIRGLIILMVVGFWLWSLPVVQEMVKWTILGLVVVGLLYVAGRVWWGGKKRS